ncbi:unnamed protein product [Nippostrongylus brasiliensis]|uniref:F-box domain-containing protein n=1 Tax=Nippostrongylus brasiliensis TaxID=27835 RepID=A0A0N4XVS1_NIPBR|nr:unnamed protein product [Nippostrongylus brasiliensis]
MSLIPLTVYDNLRRVCCSMFASSSQTDHYEIAERIIANASLADVLRWRSVSSRFRAAALRRLSRFTTIHVRVYDGLCKLYERGSSIDMNNDLSWHPAGCLLLNEMNAHELGIALDSRPKWKDVKILLALLKVNTKKINALLLFFSQNRKCDTDFTCEETTVAPMMKSQLPLGPMFPSLKQFIVTSNPQQLNHLSRLIHYAVAVDMIYQQKEIDLVCLQLFTGSRAAKNIDSCIGDGHALLTTQMCFLPSLFTSQIPGISRINGSSTRENVFARWKT